MATFREALRIAQAALSEKDLPQQEAQLLMVELCQLQVHDLYMEIDQEMEPELQKQYEEGVERLL